MATYVYETIDHQPPLRFEAVQSMNDRPLDTCLLYTSDAADE